MTTPASDGLRPAVFLDRDGTVIEEIDYLADPGRVRLISGSGPAIKSLNDAGYCVVIATNQSGLARGLLDEHTLELIHAEMTRQLQAFGARIDHIEYCPHHPEYDGVETDRRKPQPGMLLEAAESLGLDLKRSWMVGDALRDIQAGRRAGARTILVETGKGKRELERARSSPEAPHHIARDLEHAVAHIQAQGK